MTLPTHISDQALQVDEGAVRAALSRVFRRILKPIVTGLGGLYCVFALGHPVFVGGTVGVVLALVAAATGLLLLGRALRGALAQSLRTEARTRAALEESNAALEKGVTEAEEMNRLQAAFLADMSHEIRTPLTSIIGFAEVLDDRVSGEAGRFTSLILTSSRRLLDTLNSVLDLSKLDREEVRLEPEQTDVATEVRDTVRLFRAQAEEVGVSLRVEGPAAIPAALDPSALHRCCSNLVSNAVKYTGEGGSVTVRARAEADTVVVTVADTGVGIDPASQDTLFDPFEQSDEGAQQNEGGTGLGLAITQRLASLMGGAIEVESTPGEGSVFTLRLPRWAHDGEAG